MGVRYELSSSLIHVTMDGHFDASEVLEVGREALSDSGLERGSNLLVDFRQSEEVATGEDIFRRIQLLSESRDILGPRIALLVTRSVHFGLARMAELYGESHGLTIHVFTEEDAALEWVEGG
jgi:hypothetical protein